MQREEFVGIGIVKETVRGAPLVGEEGVVAGGVDGEGGPLGEVGGCGGGEGGGVGGLGGDGCDEGHGANADDAFDGEVGLVDELAGEVVCGGC